MTSGIGTMLPIVKVLISGQTVVQWVDETIASLHTTQVPFYLRWAHDAAALLPTDPIKAVAVMLGLIAIIAMVGNVVRFVYEYTSDKLAVDAVNDARKALYDHTLHIPLNYFGQRGTSDITSRLINDCQNLQEGFTTLLGQTTIEIFRAVLGGIAALWLDWRLTLFIFLFAPISLVVVKKFGTRLRRANRAALQNSAQVLGQVESSLSGIRVVKAASAERFERRRFSRVITALRLDQVRLVYLDALSTPVMETMALWMGGTIVIFATYLMFGNVAHKLSTERFLGVMVALVQISEALRRVSKLNVVVQKSSAAAGRIFEILDLPIERPRQSPVQSNRLVREPLKNLPPLNREVAFEDVTFSYPNTDAPALDHVSLTVPRGKSIAIVGRNGSGKTTLMALLPRFFDPDSGRVTIDGVDLKSVTLRSVRRQISVVTQDSVIFPGTIAENIAYGLPLASRAAIEAAATQAFAHEFITAKPQGYDTPLDGLGGQLSGGQKQRLSIARAILRATPILILDEATSQVDAESEHLIQKAIEGLIHERTTFVIAHRFSTILSADSIVVMDAGRIVGQGKHDDLIRNCAPYKQLYDRQLFRPDDAA